MKCNYFGNVSIASLILLATTAFAQSSVEANVPFAFQVGTTTLPAGHYQVVEDHLRKTVVVRNLQTDATAQRQVEQDVARDAARFKMVFHHFGNEYFLAEIHGSADTLDLTLPTTKEERKLRSLQVASGPSNAAQAVEIALK
jgi:predicted TIM-barrel fold metal-dependent hydrolase